MSDPRRPEWSDPTRPENEYPPNTDPAYSGQYSGQSWGPTYYGAGYGTQANQPTQQLPAYWQQGSPYTQGYPRPRRLLPRRSHRAGCGSPRRVRSCWSPAWCWRW